MKRRTFVQSMGIGTLLMAMDNLAKGSIDKEYGFNSGSITKPDNYLPASFQSLLDYINPGDMVFVGGRLYMGKTSFSLSIAMEYAKAQNVFIFSMKYLATQLYRECLPIVSGISVEKIMAKDLSEDDIHNISAQYTSTIRIHIDDQPLQNSQTICNSLENRGLVSGDVVIIDSLQFMNTNPGSAVQTSESIAKNVYDLALLARQKSLRVIVLSTITRALECRKDKRPMISDISDSLRDHVTQWFNKILFIYRPEYYGLSDNKNELEIIFRKPMDFVIRDEYFLEGRFENLPQQAKSIAMGWQ